MRAIAILPIFLAVTGCHEATPLVGDDILAAPAPGEGVQLEVVTELEPGQEIERCRFFQVPREGLRVNRQTVRYTPGSHHVLLFRTPYTEIPTKTTRGEEKDTRGVLDCKDGAAAEWLVEGVIGGSQSPEAAATTSLPEGVSLDLPGGAVVLVNAHYLNATAAKKKVTVRMNLYAAPPGMPTVEAGVLFFYNWQIWVPPRGEATARMRCPIRRDITLLDVQSHMHRRGVGFRAEVIEPDGTTATLYENDRWENVPIARFEGGRAIPAGSRIDYRCEYRNDEDREVVQGFTAADEMCMLVGIYHPRDKQLEFCGLDDSIYTIGFGATHVGSGGASCGATLDCLAAASGPGGEAKCLHASCPAVADPLGAVLRCRMDADADCTTFETACRAAACD